MSTPEEKVRRLLAQATSPFEEEARTAALLAARLIAQYGLQVVDPVKREPVKREPVKREPVKREPVKREPVKREPVKRDSSGLFVRIKAKYTGRCKVCMGVILLEQKVWWKHGYGCVHDECMIDDVGGSA